jgi:hypothetical protein
MTFGVFAVLNLNTVILNFMIYKKNNTDFKTKGKKYIGKFSYFDNTKTYKMTFA